jgi:ketosteroid isomerase-like protein
MKLPVVAAILVALAGPAMAQNLKGAIDKANTAFDAAYNRGDAATVASFYTPEATILPPGAPMVSGRTDIEAFWHQAMQTLKKLRLEALKVTPLGDGVAREIGRFQAEAGGHPLAGKYVVIWRRLAGAWHLDTDIWNLD